MSPLQEMIDYNVNTDRNKTQIHYKVIKQCWTLSPLQPRKEMIDGTAKQIQIYIRILLQMIMKINGGQPMLDVVTTAIPQRND